MMDAYESSNYVGQQKLIDEIKRLEDIRDFDINDETQIDVIDRKILEKKEELERIKKYGPTIKLFDKSREIIEKVEPRELTKSEMRKEEKEKKYQQRHVFRQVKELYKNTEGRSFDRFKKFISGKKPKWRKVARLSQKELEYLLATYQGKTRLTSGEIRYAENREDLSIDEQQQIIANGNWRSFTALLRNHEALKSHLADDERRGYYGRK